jgi:hypothetical protein
MKSNILEDDILADIAERKVLLLSTKTIILRYGFTEADEQFFLNYSMPIIYSIWEGFIQTTFQTYIREINRLSLNYESLCDPIKVNHIEFTFKQLKQYPAKLNQKLRFIDGLKDFFVTTPIYIKPIVNTESNVGFNVLNRLLEEFNLEKIPEYPLPRYSIPEELDKFLLKLRNDIAHGQNAVFIKREDVNRAIKLVESLMDLVLDKIKEGYYIKDTHLKEV